MEHFPKVVGGVVAGSAYVIFNNFIQNNWKMLAGVPVGIFAGELATRCVLYVQSKSKNSPLKEKHSLLEFFTKIEKSAALLVIPASSAYLVKYGGSHGPLVLTVAFGTFLVRTFISKPSPVAVKQMYGRELNGIYYGPGMAYSYFYGYMKILLTPTDGITYGNRIDKYVDETSISRSGKKINFPDKRLQILIPLSGDLTGNTNLDEHADGWLEKSRAPFVVEIDRGGISKRKYHNTVYQIWEPESSAKPIYAVAEFATPIITYMEACRLSGETDLLEYKRETIHNYHDTLKRLIEREDGMKDHVNLIPYEGLDESGKPVNVAKVLLANIRMDGDQEA